MYPTKFAMTRDINGYNGFGVAFAANNYSTTLASTVEQHFTVPADYQNWIAIFSYEAGTSIWVDGTTTAVLPGGSFAATTSQLNPAGRLVHGGDVISFITNSATAEVGVALYAIS